MDFKKIFSSKVVKAGSWYTITDLFTKGIAFLTIPIFTRLLSTEDYGMVSIFNTWMAIFWIIISLDFWETIGIAKNEFKEKYDEYTSSIVFLSIIIFIVFLFFSLIFIEFFLKLTNLNFELFIVMIFMAFFSYIQELILSKFRFEYKYKIPSIIIILRVIFSVILSILLILYCFEDNKYLGKIYGNFIPMIPIGVVFIIYILVKGKTLINLKYWKFALITSLPMIIHTLSAKINSQFDRIVIDRYVGSVETGIYSFSYDLSMIISVLILAANRAWMPWLFEKMEKSDYFSIKNKGKIFRDFFSLVYGLLLLLSPEIIKIMADESYWEGLVILPILFLAIYFQFLYSFEVNIELFLKKTSLISIGTFFAAGINVGLNFWLVPKFGYIAAAYTTLISYIFLFIFHYIFTAKVIKTKIFGLKFHLFAIISSFSITLFFIIFQNYLLIRLFGVIVLLYLLYRKLERYYG